MPCVIGISFKRLKLNAADMLHVMQSDIQSLHDFVFHSQLIVMLLSTIVPQVVYVVNIYNENNLSYCGQGAAIGKDL